MGIKCNSLYCTFVRSIFDRGKCSAKAEGVEEYIWAYEGGINRKLVMMIVKLLPSASKFGVHIPVTSSKTTPFHWLLNGGS